MSKKMLFIIGAVAAAIVVMALTVEATSQPGFCARCHEISPAVESWRKYSHNEVSCMECHADPGAIGVIKRKVGAYREVYVHFFGEAPREMEAKVNFQNCLLCHSGKRTSKYPQAPNIAKGDKELVESHKNVLSNQTSCLLCHRETAHGEQDF